MRTTANATINNELAMLRRLLGGERERIAHYEAANTIKNRVDNPSYFSLLLLF